MAVENNYDQTDGQYKYQCSRCNHSWKPRAKHPPVSCPKCKSYLWDKAKSVI